MPEDPAEITLRCAVVVGGEVETVLLATTTTAAKAGWVPVPADLPVDAGWRYADGEWSAPARQDLYVLTWDDIRIRRAGLLAACDWTQLPDSPLTTDQRTAWADYRQALRDITETYSDPAAVVWPQPPSA